MDRLYKYAAECTYCYKNWADLVHSTNGKYLVTIPTMYLCSQRRIPNIITAPANPNSSVNPLPFIPIKFLSLCRGPGIQIFRHLSFHMPRDSEKEYSCSHRSGYVESTNFLSKCILELIGQHKLYQTHVE